MTWPSLGTLYKQRLTSSTVLTPHLQFPLALVEYLYAPFAEKSGGEFTEKPQDGVFSLVHA